MALINTLKISAAQVKLCVAIIDYFKAKKKDADGNEISEEVRERWNKGLFRRVELREAHKILADREACPYFITKNIAAKNRKGEHADSLYNLQRFIDHAAKHPPAEKEETAEGAEKPKKTAKKKPAKKEAGAKKEAKAKGKKKKEEPEAAPAEGGDLAKISDAINPPATEPPTE